LQSTYQKQWSILDELQAARQQAKQLQESTKAFDTNRLDQAPPYDIDLLDQLLDTRDRQVLVSKSAKLALQGSESLRGSAQSRYQDAHLKVVHTQQLLQSAPEGKKGELQSQLETLRLKSDVAEQELVLEKLKDVLTTAELATSSGRISLLKAKIKVVYANISFTAEQLHERLVGLRKAATETQASIGTLNTHLALREELLAKSRAEQESAVGNSNKAELLQQTQTRLAWVQTSRCEIEIAEERLQGIAMLEKVWKDRFELHQGDIDRKQFTLWSEEAKQVLASFDLARGVREAQLGDLRSAILQVQERNTQDKSDQYRALVADEIRALQEKETVLSDSLTVQAPARQTVERFASEILLARDSKSFRDQLKWLGEGLSEIWRYDLYTLSDRKVTVRKVSIALFVLVMGVWLSRLFVAGLKNRLLHQFKVKKSVVVVIEKLLYYSLLITVFLLALKVVNIPLTVFTFLGGSMAIAAGFGAQNILNNFISGLILMVEQPVKVGDLIAIKDSLGTVQEIGARSTKVRTFSGIHIVVPNSSLLENDVTNWTLEDHTMRISVDVGVAYDSPVDKVFEIVAQCAQEHPRVHREPQPIVLLAGFGDSTLNFEVHFWIHVEELMDKRIIESDVRRLLCHHLSEKGIVIAFPQRDVHLDAAVPLRVEVVSEPESGKRD